MASLRHPGFWDSLFPDPNTSQRAIDDALLIDLFVSQGVPRRLPAYDDLFVRDDPTTHLYYLETGKLLIHRPIGRSATGRARSAIRHLYSGQLFSCDVNDKRVANCTAITDSILLCMDKGWLNKQAALDPRLERSLKSMHAMELCWVLQSKTRTVTSRSAIPSQGTGRTK